MQVRVFEGNPDVFNALIYPEQTQTARRFIEDQFIKVSETLTETGRQFINGAKDLYDRIVNSPAMATARAIMNQTNIYFDPNLVMSIDNLEGLQQAKIGMQRWIMAQPDVRKAYHEQRIDGYADTYVDMHPNDIGENHYDYRRVMDGVVVENLDGSWMFAQYLDELYENDRSLNISEKSDILHAWDIAKLYIERSKEDPTSPFGSEMG